MAIAIANTRDVIMLSLACIAGALIAPVLPVAGLPLCAAGLGGLIFRGYRVQTALTAVLATACAAWVRLVDPIAVGIAIAAILVAATRLRRSDVYTTGIWFAPVLGLGFAGTEYVAAAVSGVGFGEYLSSAMNEAAKVLGTAGAVGGIPVSELTDTMLRFTPAIYLLMGVAAAIPSLAALVWAAGRTGAVIKTSPRLERVDLSPHVLWPLVVSASCLAAGRIWGGADGLLTTVGLNLLMVSRVALLVQGLALVAALLGKAGIKGPGLTAGILMALLLDSTTWFVSLAGLSDFWINFRRVNRGTPAEGPDGPLEGP